MMKLHRSLLVLLPLVAVGGAPTFAAPPPRPINIIARPSAFLPDSVISRPGNGAATQNSTTTARAPAARFEAAPVPNRDVDAPLGARAAADPQLSAGLFTRRDQYRGEGISAKSSAQIEQERHVLPGAGFKLRMPLQQ